MDRIQTGPIRTGWHWLGYNFTPVTPGFVSVGGPTCIALANGDAVMPGFAVEQLARLEAMGGPEKDMGQYRQIVSWYSELLVTAHLAARRWPVPATFAMEPTAGDSKMNPELVVELDGVGALGVEVKAPDLGGHQELRSSNDWQLNGRVPVSLEALEGGVTLPRDNPMKDFLVGADGKFAGFKAADPEFRSVWSLCGTTSSTSR